MQELSAKLTTMGEPLTEEECAELLAHADKDGSGNISIEEFKAMECWGLTRSGDI